VKRKISRLRTTAKSLRGYADGVAGDDIKLALGRIETRQIKNLGPTGIDDAEFKVFSQWGEDGLIQFLLHHGRIDAHSFVEFGVESYRESNTRFLLQHDHWSGLIIDGGSEHVDFLRRSGLLWKHDITAASSFVTAENIDELIVSHGFEGQVGILSVDVDGVDYWIIDKITSISPQIVVVEYNGFFGPELALTVPYRPDFMRGSAHPSNFYWGASLAAFESQLRNRDYALVGCNSAGNNAFFVRRDCLGALVARTVEEAFKSPTYWEYSNAAGSSPVGRNRFAMFELLGDLPFIDVLTGSALAASTVAELAMANDQQRRVARDF
jgi:hypothetical protein